MTRKDDEKAAFVSALATALEAKTFIKLTLGKFRGEGEPSKAVATLVALKGVPHLKLVTSLARKDETKTFSINDGINHIKSTTASITLNQRSARRISVQRCSRRTAT